MEYTALTFSTDTEISRELLFAVLDSEGFEGITENENQVIAYIPAEEFNSGNLESMLSVYNISDEVFLEKEEVIKQKNWNEEWEKNFDPIIINEQCVIRAPFHEDFAGCKYILTIEPKMSFGTGHHETTRLVMQQMFQHEFNGKKVLDMGCGTGILAILAAKLGAGDITAIDYDIWSYENTLENIQRNNTTDIKVLHGGKEVIPKEKFDIIIANINRNILEDQISEYLKRMHTESLLFLSGILVDDFDYMQNLFNQHKLLLKHSENLNKWGVLKVQLSS